MEEVQVNLEPAEEEVVEEVIEEKKLAEPASPLL